MARKLTTRGNVVEEQDEVRRRIARQLHDTAAQHGAALQINLALLAESHPVLGRRAAQALSDSFDLTQALARDIREIEFALHPALLDQLGLVSAIESWTQRFSEQTGVPVQLDLPSQLERFPSQVETGLFRIVEEGLANTREAASLSLKREGKSLVLELTIPRAIGEAGIANIRERARLLGGRLTVQHGARNTRFRMVLRVSSRRKSTSAGS